MMGRDIRHGSCGVAIYCEEGVAEKMLRQLIALREHGHDDVGEDMSVSLEAPVIEDCIGPVGGFDPVRFATIESSAVHVKDFENRQSRCDLLCVGRCAEWCAHPVLPRVLVRLDPVLPIY